MKRDLSYQEKFHLLKEWMPSICESVKKELRNEHLKQDYGFVKRFLAGKNPQKADAEELSQAYLAAFEDKEVAEGIGEFITSRWILRHSDIYNFFETELRKIQDDMTAIESLTPAQADAMIKGASQEFGYRDSYIFSVLNAVAFNEAQLSDFGSKAVKESKERKEQAVKDAEAKSVEQIKRACELEVSRLTDKYEKKLIGLQKKYTEDTAQLKKQIANLQRKLTGAAL